MVYAFVLVFGLLIGSFLNVLIYRLPKEEDFVFSSSHCMNCNKRIRWYDLFPVFSYILLRGRCRYCSAKISIQYPIIEAVNGLFYMFIFWYNGYDLDTLLYAALFSVLLVISMIDYSHYIIPNGTVVFIGLLGLVRLVTDLGRWLDYVIGFFAVSLVLFLIAVVTKGKMGGGDIKLMAAAGLLLGWKAILLALFIGSILGSIIGLMLILTKTIRRDQMIPFGPFLSLGIIIAAVFSEEIISWYLSIII